MILDPLCLFAMDCALYVSLYDLVKDKCSMLHVCENASMSVYPNVKLLKKKSKKFYEVLSKFIGEKDDLIVKLNESNKLVEKYKKLAENSFEKMKEFECLNVDLDAKLVLSNKLEFIGSCAKKAKSDLIDDGKLLK